MDGQKDEMSLEPTTGTENVNARDERTKTVAASVVAILGAFLIMAAMVWIVSRYTRPEAVDANRATERRQALEQIRRSDEQALGSYGYVDAGKGQVRLPIERAMELTVQEARNPVALRSNLLARVEQFNPPPPPPAPAEPSPFE